MKVRFPLLKGKDQWIGRLCLSQSIAFNIQNSHRLQFSDFHWMSHRSLRAQRLRWEECMHLVTPPLVSLSIQNISFSPGIHDLVGLSAKAYYCAEYPPGWVCGWSEGWIRFTWRSCIFDGASSDVFLTFFLAVFCPVVPGFNLFGCSVAQAGLKLALFLLRPPKCWP